MVRTWFIPPLWFAALAVAITLLAWTADDPVILGLWEALDVTGSVWSHWWTADALSRGVSPFIGTHSYLPVGLEPVLQYNLLDGIIHAPFVLLLGPQTGYNAALAFAWFASGWAGFSVARSAGRSVAASVFAGTLVQASSTVLFEAHEGRISQVTLVFFLLALREAAVWLQAGPNLWSGVRLGLLAAATAMVYWYYGFALILALVVLACVCRERFDRRSVVPLAVAAVVGAALTVPFALELLREWTALPGVSRLEDIDVTALDPDSRKSGLTVAIEASRWPLWPFMRDASSQYGHQLSPLALLACVVAVRAKSIQARAWLAVALLGWILAMGPVLRYGDTITDIRLPFWYLQEWVPTFSRMWWPQRFELLTVVGGAMAAAVGLDHWLERRRHRKRWAVLAVLLCVVDAPVRSGLGPIAITPTPPSYPALYDSVDGPILTVPVLPEISEAMRLQWNQTVHGLPTQNGDGEHIPSHRPPGFTAFMESNGLIRALKVLHIEGTVDIVIEPSDVAELIDSGFEFAVTDPAVFGSKPRARAAAHGEVFKALWGEPIHRYRGGAVWRISALDSPVVVRTRLRSGRERQSR